MRNRTISSRVIGPKLLELLGIPSENCLWATIEIRPNSTINVEAEFYASMELNPDTKQFETPIKRYTLVEKKEEQ